MAARGSAVNGHRNGVSTGTNGSATKPSLPAETFTLRATPSIKRYNIARFDVPQVPKLADCAQPVMMYREPEKVIEDEDEQKKEEEIGYNPALRKRRRRRRKDTRTANWVIEDQTGAHKFVGAFEGGQSSMYCLFVKNRHNDEMSVIPVEQWFRFKKPLNYRTLTLEEAEDLNNEKKRAVERWLMRHKMFGEDKNDTGDVIGAPRVRTGALGGGGGANGGAARGGGGGAGGKKKATAANADDIFEVKEARPRRVAPRAQARPVEGGEAMGEDGGDFDEKFDDDESEAEIEHDDGKALASESEEEDELVEGDGSGKLTETGQAMKDLLRRAQSGDIDATNALEAEGQAPAEDHNGSDDEYSAQDMEKVVRRDLGGNIIRDRVPMTTSMGGPSVVGMEEGIGGKATGEAAGQHGVTAVGGGVNGMGASASGKGAAGSSGGNGAAAVSEANGSGKRKASDDGAQDTPSKQAKTSATSSSSASAGSAPRLTEAGVQQELLRYGGRMKTRDLLKKLKKLLLTDDDRALLKDILRTICEVEKDAIEGNLFVLKTQFR